MAKARNKDLIQSYVLTTAKYDFNVYEKRVLYRVVELAQAQLEGKKLDGKINHDLGRFVDITIPISSLLAKEADKNHSRIKQALTRLQDKKIEYEDDEIWTLIPFISTPVVKKRALEVNFIMNKMMWDVILNFTKGHKKYELKVAMSFESVYSMRFYELLSGQKKPITYSIDKLKEMFRLENKYARINDFVKKVIIPAQKELNENSPYSFTYAMNKTGRKITSITFKPVFISKNRDPELERRELQKKASVSWDLRTEVTEYLKYGFGFEIDEIKRNIDLFKRAQNELEDVLYLLSRVKARINSEDVKNPKGYVIGALKKELK